MSSRTSSIVIGVLGVAVVALAIFTVIQTSDLNSKVSDLEDATAGLESATTTGGKDAAAEIEDLSQRVKKLRTCLPELQNEINGLSVEVESGFAYIENNSQVSSYCQPLLYPQPQGGE
jgi:peptidoglycan hydrolase CwlO-like protein